MTHWIQNLKLNNPIIIGAGFAVAQSIIFSFMGLVVKLAAENGHHPVDMMFFRSFICLMIVTGFLALHSKLSKVRHTNFKNQIIRGVVGSIGMVLTFAAFAMLPLSEVQSLLFAAPIFVVALSYPLLREKVGIYRASAAIIGFCGVLIIIQPDSISNFAGGLVGLTAAVFHALVMIILRWLGKTEDPYVTIFYFSVISTAMMIPVLPIYFTMPTMFTGFLLGMTGVLAFCLQVCLTKSYIYADASVIAPITYLNLLWSVILDLAIFGYC